MQEDEEAKKSSVIRYTEFEKRILSRSSNLYRGTYLFPWGWYALSSWLIGFYIVFSLFFLGYCLWNPTVSNIMSFSSLIFFSIHYLLGVMITQFKVRRRIVLFSALLMLSLSFILLLSSQYLYPRAAPPDSVSQVIFTALFMICAIPFASMAYVLIQAYRGKYDEHLNRSF